MMTDRDTRSRIASAYHEAYHETFRTIDNTAYVSVHVGQEVWDWCQALANRVSSDTTFADFEVRTMFGFPLILEKSWDPHRMEVRTTRVIW